MILPCLDTETGDIRVYERVPKRPGCLNGLHLLTPAEMAFRAAHDEEELAHMAMCGMFAGPYGPEDFTWR